jgi:PBSX family phage terminase large subunit
MSRTTLKLLPGQILVRQKIKEGYKEIYMTCGTGYGKTYGGARLTLLELIDAPPGSELIAMSPTIAMVKRTVVRQMLLALDEWGYVKDEDYSYNISDRELTWLETGSILYAAGAEAHDAIQGIHPYFIWVDECGLYRDAAWLTIEQRASFADAPIFGSSTPYYWNRYKEKVDRYNANPNDPKKRVFAFRVPSIANPDYPLEVYEDRKENWPEWKFQMMYQGLFTSPIGLIYPHFRECVVPSFDVPASWLKWGSIDYGGSETHPTAITWFAKDPEDGIIYIWDEWKDSEVGITEIIEQIKNRPYKYYADHSGRQITNELRRKGHDVENAIKGDVEATINLVFSAFKKGELKVFNTCVEIEQEALKYTWKLDKNDKPTNKPEKIFDDCMDSMRYGYISHLDNPEPILGYQGDGYLENSMDPFRGFL